MYKGLLGITITEEGDCICTFGSPFNKPFVKQFSPDQVTYDDIMSWIEGDYIQSAMSNLSPDQRDWFIAGVEDY